MNRTVHRLRLRVAINDSAFAVDPLRFVCTVGFSVDTVPEATACTQDVVVRVAASRTGAQQQTDIRDAIITALTVDPGDTVSFALVDAPRIWPKPNRPGAPI